MTTHQNMALWEMVRQGLHRMANLAEYRWEHGEPVERDDAPHVPRLLWALVEQGNSQIPKNI